MPDQQKFDQRYLSSLLRSNPASPEELEQAKLKIDLYFRQLQKTQQKPVAARTPGPQSSTKSKSLNTTSKKTGPARQWSKETKYRVKFALTWAIMFASMAFVMIARVFGLSWLPVVFLIGLGLLMRRQIYRYITAIGGIQDSQLEEVGLGHMKNATRSNRPPNWARKCGESKVVIFRQKWQDLEKWINKTLEASDLQSALGPAEECLSILNYFDTVQNVQVPPQGQEKQHQSTDIDPLNTLIERLIDDHELTWADKLSQHYLKLLSPDF